MCATRGLSSEGLKPVLVERLLEFQAGEAGEAERQFSEPRVEGFQGKTAPPPSTLPRGQSPPSVPTPTPSDKSTL